MTLFKAENIVKRFDNHTALNGVSIDVPEGKIFGLLGPNGAGKTTLIRIINQITAPDSGALYFNGRPLKRDDMYNVGYLPEERGLYRNMKVGEHAIYLAQLKGLSKNDAIHKIKEWFERLEIGHWWNKKIDELSKGMQQKIQFIVTVLHEPKLIIFDEPFSGFDPINTNILKKEIINLRDQGATIIFSTHNMNSVEELCDNITLINNAENILSGTISEVREKYRSNIYEIEFGENLNLMQATLSTNYKIISSSKENNKNILKLELMNNINRNQLISSFLALGNMHSFNEIMPSMNDIFIKVVEEHESQKQNTETNG